MDTFLDAVRREMGRTHPRDVAAQLTRPEAGEAITWLQMVVDHAHHTHWPEFAAMLQRGEPGELRAALPEWLRPD